MNASIQSKDELKDSRGVTLSVSSDTVAVSASATGITVRASENEVISSSALTGSGPVQDITRVLTLELSPPELKQLFDAAISAGLVRVSLLPRA